MPYLFDKKNTLYQPVVYNKEADFEKVVVELSDQIFGADSIYVDIKKRIRNKNIVTIPDGYVIDMADPDNPNLYIIENEISTHDFLKHIGIQVLKFVTSFDAAKDDVREFLMEHIAKNKSQLTKLNAIAKKSKFRNIDNFLDHAIYQPFKGIVVIDKATDDLHNVLGNITAQISVIELKTYKSDEGALIHQFDTLYDESDEATTVVTAKKSKKFTAEERRKRRDRRINSDTIIVPARKDGFKKVFLGEDAWYKIRVGAAMMDKIKYIAAYQVAPISAVTHIAEVKDIKPYKNTGKYIINFKASAKKIKPIKLKNTNNSPQGACYTSYSLFKKAKTFEDLLK